MSMWTFYIELSEIKTTTESDLPKIVFAFGDTPETAPEKEFVADKLDDEFGFEDDAYDDFGSFENIDDYDF